MGEEAGQKGCDEYRKKLIRHFSDSNDPVQVGQGRAEKTKANHLRAHRATNKVRSETYCERSYDGLRGIAVNSKEY